MQSLVTRYTIKVPKSLTVFYCDNKKLLLVKGQFSMKIVPLNLHLLLTGSGNRILVTDRTFCKALKNQKKKIRCSQGTTVALIKKSFLEVSRKPYKKLKLFGVGFRYLFITFANIKIIHFKLGYSHSIYFKVPKDIGIIGCTYMKLIISGTSHGTVSKIASTIKQYKIIEPYKGKGILYENETITLKEGKKV